MIRFEKYAHIVTLLNQGYSNRLVARMAGVSRGTVDRIFNGTFPTERLHSDKIVYFNYFAHTYTRCPKCGVKVKVPCLKCELEKL